MPELPEVETIRVQLRDVLVGQKIKSVEVRRGKSFSGKPKNLIGYRVAEVDRKAKVMAMELVKGKERRYLLVHLKMTGQLIYQEDDPPSLKPRKDKAGQLIYQETRNKKPADAKAVAGRQETSNKQISNPKFHDHKKHFKYDGRIVGGHPTADWVAELPNVHTRVIVKLDKGVLFFNDMRVFGWMKMMSEDEYWQTVNQMPPDVIEKGMSEGAFYGILQSTRRPVKVVVMDSQKIGGVGNIYANDGLWKARIDPKRAANSLSRSESDRLLRALKSVVNLGIKYGGATASDDKFVQASGLGGKYQEHFLTYEKEGEKCKRCGGVISKIKLGGRGTYYCPGCQVGPSKFS